ATPRNRHTAHSTPPTDPLRLAKKPRTARSAHSAISPSTTHRVRCGASLAAARAPVALAESDALESAAPAPDRRMYWPPRQSDPQALSAAPPTGLGRVPLIETGSVPPE